MALSCCGKEPTWIVQSQNLAYWFCKECKKEVKEESDEDFKVRMSNTALKSTEELPFTQTELDDLFSQIDWMNLSNNKTSPLTAYQADEILAEAGADNTITLLEYGFLTDNQAQEEAFTLCDDFTQVMKDLLYLEFPFLDTRGAARLRARVAHTFTKPLWNEVK